MARGTPPRPCLNGRHDFGSMLVMKESTEGAFKHYLILNNLIGLPANLRA